jgi:hypothetical protein
VHALLLDGKSLTIERPARSTGIAVGAALCIFAVAVALVLLFRALDWPASFAQFAAYTGAAVMALVALTFAFWTYACIAMRYTVDGQAVTVRWGPVVHRIAIGSITAVTRGRADDRIAIKGVGWPGYHVGKGEAGGQETLFFSTHRDAEDLVYVKTASLSYGLSPRDPDRFVAAVDRAQKAGVGEVGAPQVTRQTVAAHPIWHDRIGQVLLIGSLLLNAALWAFVLTVHPDLSNEITIEFPPIGDIATLQSRDEIFRIPATASAILLVNSLAALLFHPRERAVTYLLLSGSVFFQVVFWVAAVVAVVNA